MSAVAPAIALRSDRYFHTAMAVAMAATVFIGFAPTFYLRSAFAQPALTPLLVLHGALFTLWMLLFLVQTALVANARVAVHRRLGIAGALLALALFVIGAMTAIALARRGQAPEGAQALPFLLVPLATIVVFLGTVLAALHFRRRRDIHKRLMLVATIGVLTPAIARILINLGGFGGPPMAMVLTDLFLLPCLIRDRRVEGRIHPAYLWGGGILLGSQIARVLVMNSEAWLATAAWLIR